MILRKSAFLSRVGDQISNARQPETANQVRHLSASRHPFNSQPTNLNQQGYKDLILEKDRWQHFLVPNPN